MANFFIRTNKTKGRATLYIRVQKVSPKIDWRYVNTYIVVDIADWLKYYVNGGSSDWNNYTKSGSVGAELKEKMDKVEETVNLLFNEGRIKSNADKQVITDALFELANHDAIKMREEIRERKQEEEKRKLHEIVNCCECFIKGIKEGTIKDTRSGRAYTIGTIKNWGTFLEYLKDYTRPGITFEEITPEWIERFRLYLERKGLMPTTINKHFGTGQKLCNYAALKGWNKNAVSLRAWQMQTVKKSEKQTEIYLTEDELNALYDMKLEGQRDKVRDLFFLGVFSGQRVSDFSQFSRHNFTKTEKGTNIIRLTQKKTGNSVEAPILDARCYEILRKYDYQSPEVPLQRVNLILKEIFKELATSVPSLMQEYTTAMTRREKDAEKTYLRLCQKFMNNEPMTNNERAEYRRLKQYSKEHDGDPVYRRDGRGNIIKYKYELITSHTARRSAITNLSKAGILTDREIMAISGHASLENLEKYIKTGLSERADEIFEKVSGAKKAKEIKFQKEA